MEETSTHNTAITVAPTPKQMIRVAERGLQFTDLDSMVRFAKYIEASGLAPKGVDKLEAIVVAMQLGAEIGLPPLAALQNIAVVNGRPTLWGDAQLGVVRSTGDLEAFAEWYESSGKRLPRNPSDFPDDLTAVCEVKRRGYPSAQFGFSVSDAKRAGLWGKQGPWAQHPARMLRYRARGFVLRDQFGDALRGMKSTEEMQDSQAIEVESTARPATGNVIQVNVSEPAPVADVTMPDTGPAASPQELLAESVVDAGFNFDQFRVVAVKMGRITDKPGAFDELSTKDAEFFSKNFKGLLAAMKQSYPQEAK
jgi:hypothetical protein